MQIVGWSIIAFGRGPQGIEILLTSLPDDIKEMDIAHFPLGTPPPKFSFILPFTSTLLISSFLSKNEALAIALHLDKESIDTCPLRLVPGNYQLLQDILDQGIPEELPQIKFSMTDEKSCNISTVASVPNFESLLYALLTRQQIILIGEVEEIEKFTCALLSILPISLMTTLKIITHSKKLSNDWNIIGIPPQRDILEELDTFFQKKLDQITVVDLKTKQIFGEKHSPFLSRLATELQKENTEIAKALITNFLEFAKTIDPQTPINELIKKYPSYPPPDLELAQHLHHSFLSSNQK